MNIKILLFRLIGFYSVIMGIFYAVGLGLSYAELNYTYRHAALLQILIQSIAIVMVFWLIIGGLLSFKKYSGVIGFILIISQMIIEFLAGFTTGLFFVPGTVLLIVSEIGYNLMKSR
ncbi:Uncharacterised protein [uncultured archaeon]|nr:Uncharacterised protein [uncultured archaeon]